MELKKQANLLNDFLIKYKDIWSKEIMNEYPHSLVFYPEQWILDLTNLTTEELFKIDSKTDFSPLKNSGLLNFIHEIQTITEIAAVEKTNEIPLENWAFVGVKFKKRHEIQKLVPHILNVYKAHSISHINDIGGGVGHLSRILAHYHGIPSISIDQNKMFQEIGEKRLKRFRKIKNAEDVKFINRTFGENSNQNSDIFTDKSFSLGLHTCGNLAVKLIDENIKYETAGLLSFGCCYYKMDSLEDFPISIFYKTNHFTGLNLFGLTLGTRSHAEHDYQNFLKKEKVKYYRNGLHLFFIEKFNRYDLDDIGECPLAVYDEPFSNYALMKLSELKLAHQESKESIDSFYHSTRIQETLKKMFLCNIIRWQTGRAIEVFILIDRALKLIENNYKAEINQYFNEALSPRNIGILALSNKLSQK